MTSMWVRRSTSAGAVRACVTPVRRGSLTLASLNWVIANRAYTRGTLVRYWRLLKFAGQPHIITCGMVFLGKNVEIHATPELAQMEIGRWVHIGDKNTIRAHEGLAATGRQGGLRARQRHQLLHRHRVRRVRADGRLVLRLRLRPQDGQHRMPIKDQGIVKTPVRIGPDVWIAAKVTILRGTTIGRGCVLGAHAVVKGDIPDYSIAVGSPGQGGQNGKLAWETSAAQRAELAAALADIERKKASASRPVAGPASVDADDSSPSIGGPASGSGVAVGSGPAWPAALGCRCVGQGVGGSKVRSEDDPDLTGRHRCLDG